MIPVGRGQGIGGPLLAVVLVLGLGGSPADARQSIKKSIWGPVRVNGISQFPTYKALGVGIHQTQLPWNSTAPNRPARPTDPADPAYRWPRDLDDAVAESSRHGIRMLLLVQGSPPWANGGRDPRWAADDPGDFADFMTAAARRYPGVRLWMIWGEPSRGANFQPLVPERRDRPLTRLMRRGPHAYARMLDAAYGALKRTDRRNLVIGGNSFVTGDISPRNWIRNLRLPSGKAARMDLYGHNPYGPRRPKLRRPPLGHGFADFSDLDTLSRWVDRYLRRPRGRRMKLFLSEFSVPTDNFNEEFRFYVSRRTAASWLRSALRITRRWPRIYSLGWYSLYDPPPNPAGNQPNLGLLDHRGRRKPAFAAYKRG